MFQPNLLILVVFLINNITALRRDSDVYFEDVTPTLKQSSSSILADVARELIRRSSNSSQVLNLNLSNLLLLLVLKAVVYGAGYIGNHASKRRDVDEENILTDGETALALGYIIGDTCLYKAACEVPHTAKEYLGAAEMIYQTVKFMPRFVDIDESYEIKMVELQKAIDLGFKDQCPSDYKCKRDNIHRILQPQ